MSFQVELFFDDFIYISINLFKKKFVNNLKKNTQTIYLSTKEISEF